jgi:predicted membrane protein
MRKKNNIYLYPFILLVLVILITRFVLEKSIWDSLLLMFWPISLCFLIWSLSVYTFYNKLFTSFCAVVSCVFFWYDLSSIDVFIILPFSSGIIAMVYAVYCDKKYTNKN